MLKRLSEDVSRSKPTKTTPNFLASWVLPQEEIFFETPYKGTYPGLMLLGNISPAITHAGCLKK
jgi:hypothetical protein